MTKIKKVTTTLEKIVNYSFFVFLLLFSNSILNAQTINVLSSESGPAIKQKIESAPIGATVKFVDNTYNMGGVFIALTKSIIIEGKAPVGFNPIAAGSTGNQTTVNGVSFLLLSSNVTFRNIDLNQPNKEFILIDGRTQDYKDRVATQNAGAPAGTLPSNILFTNVKLMGGYYTCFAGDGIGAKFTNVTFYGYDRLGYINDRRSLTGTSPKVEFTKCSFEANPTTAFFDARGISFDAGNTENTLVWDANVSIVKECYFKNSGIALSRMRRVNIADNTFESNTSVRDMIHVEEFSYGINITGNQFRSLLPQSEGNRIRVITLDSELQYVNGPFANSSLDADKIKIDNNTVTGYYNFFVNGYACSGVNITNNKLGGGTTSKASNGVAVINFNYYENAAKNEEQIIANQEFPSNFVNITGNTGLENGNLAVKIRVPSSGSVVSIQSLPTGKLDRITIPAPTAIIGNGTYYITNAADGNKKLASTSTSPKDQWDAVVTKNLSTGTTVEWTFEWVPPYYYRIKNNATNSYLRVFKGYTENEIENNLPQNQNVFLSNNGTPANLWIVRRDINDPNKLKILPGGNEKQSCINATPSSNNTGLIFHKRFITPGGAREIIPSNVLTNTAKWYLTRK